MSGEINTDIGNMDQQIKKRGRKPKSKPNEEEVKIPKKRGRKPLGKIIDYTKVNLQSLNIDDDCIIAHLPIRISDIGQLESNNESGDGSNNNETIADSNEIDKNMLLTTSYTPAEESIRESCRHCDKNIKTIEYLNNKIDELEQNSIENIMANSKKVYKLNIDLVDLEGNEYTPKDACCWWCCNKFLGENIGLPEKYYQEKFYVFGIFCSFNCALAYNININDNKVWERYNLLHFLYKKIFNCDIRISPSPPRELLTMFGGPLTIEEYRKKTQYLGNFTKSFRTLLPPMTTIFPIVEETLKDDSINNRDRLKPIPLNEIKIHRSDLKLKRSKPLNKYKNSLEKIIKINK
jgi:hypothetical protein